MPSKQDSGLAWIESSALERSVELVASQKAIAVSEMEDMTEETRIALRQASVESVGACRVCWVMRVAINHLHYELAWSENELAAYLRTSVRWPDNRCWQFVAGSRR